MMLEHLIAILSSLPSNLPSAQINVLYSTWDKEKVINEQALAEWIGVSVKTLRAWRLLGKGPQFEKLEKKLVGYQVGTIREWLKSRKVQSTTEADTLKFGGMEFDTVFPTIYIDYQPRPFFESLDEELNITGYEVLWAEKDSLASWYLSVCELGIDIDAIIGELEKRVNDGLDINAPQSFIKNNEAYTACFSHIVAKQKMELFQEYALLINTLFKLDIDFTQTNSNGETAIDLAKQCGNENLVKMIESKALFDKLNEMLPAKDMPIKATE